MTGSMLRVAVLTERYSGLINDFDVKLALDHPVFEMALIPVDEQDPDCDVFARSLCTPVQEYREILKAREGAEEMIIRQLRPAIRQWLNRNDTRMGYPKK